MDLRGGGWQPHWAFIPPRRPTIPRVVRPGSSPEPDRRLHPGPAGSRTARAFAAGRAGHLAPACDPRPHRSAADPRRDRWRSNATPPRTPTRRPSIASWPRRGSASGWRSVAQRRALCRYQRLSDRRARESCGGGATGSSMPTTAYALRPVHDRAARRRPDSRSDAGADRSRPVSTATTAATPRGVSSPRNSPWSTWSIASTPRRASGWA